VPFDGEGLVEGRDA
jgi:hypothetical protein